ncbi:MAG: 50S ribosomal protein L32 [Acidimicrobiia bacterium]|nr:50S ribosomal protein L32 [Acidimicrobiia bacterium]MBT8249607.1 50S ribosomal protein L32 [Acidimicrobiia bacterium]NNC41873.1 50S ribosomal protein L32 [Acidimicrobiia bacterium]NND13308.1 50S ribosomal protein L32 [Acidimicrobiia bacterium]NNL27780.1 50S ribosomal protein L32 [Acidimicrobiia bacterium]
MAVPKKKMSRSRSRQRKAAWKVASPTISECSNCGEHVLPHRACRNCGQYRGRTVGETASA